MTVQMTQKKRLQTRNKLDPQEGEIDATHLYMGTLTCLHSCADFSLWFECFKCLLI